MKSLILCVSAILLIINLAISAPSDGKENADLSVAPTPGKSGDLKTDATFWWPWFWGLGGYYGGGFGGYYGGGYPYGGYGGGPYGGYGGGWAPHL